ncbi:MAG: hypothetical protein KDC66_22985 [Phaeodactylibacter sp.]|nr:hypothetical protein [Phaeodactylibacter sp.]MCB9276778.1 hypothetical protein [Lewinellaceae bacterium]
MGLLQDIRLMAHRRSLKRQLRHKSAAKGKGAVNLKNASSIGILFDATSLADRDDILHYAEQLRKRNKRISLLGFFNDATDSDNYPFKFFNRKQMDWALRPNSEDVREFIAQDFDLLLNIDPVSKVHSEYIAALSKAKLRVGPSTEHTYCYDLMIDTSAGAGLQPFIEQMEFLLGKTNVQHEPAQV